jgi:hypothetical protein
LLAGVSRHGRCPRSVPRERIDRDENPPCNRVGLEAAARLHCGEREITMNGALAPIEGASPATRSRKRGWPGNHRQRAGSTDSDESVMEAMCHVGRLQKPWHEPHVLAAAYGGVALRTRPAVFPGAVDDAYQTAYIRRADDAMALASLKAKSLGAPKTRRKAARSGLPGCLRKGRPCEQDKHGCEHQSHSLNLRSRALR